MATITVAFQKLAAFTLTDVDPAAMTVGELKDQLEAWSHVPVAGQKLLFRGKSLTDAFKPLAEFGVPATGTAKLLLMGSTSEAIAQMQRQKAPIPYKPVSLYGQSSPPRGHVRHVGAIDDEAGFDAIDVLPLPMADRARAFLDKLRNDVGIRGIMKQYKWRVGKLIELSPTEHTILGYNRNKGQVIALRLRTDDFEGFRHYDSVRKVLLHELAHMVWSEHDENFHALNRQLNKDVVELDWTLRGNRLLAAAGTSSVFGDTDDATDGAYVGGVFRLGGSTSTDLTPAERAARAALSRLTKAEEDEQDRGCGGARNTHDHV
ncbi:hypothetical protein GGF32_002468 [Allomyces javanicus]|nr:hypothetical protein GGF32_002468 [Allomyces javanicus]